MGFVENSEFRGFCFIWKSFFFNINFEKYIRMSWGDAETAEIMELPS